jgi:hypothetical protein
MKVALSREELANLIERFLDGKSLYPQEWNDFVDHGIRVQASLKPIQDRCDDLDPFVNSSEPEDPAAIAELRQMIVELRSKGV